jgi:hypothetical protein
MSLTVLFRGDNTVGYLIRQVGIAAASIFPSVTM